MNLLFDTNIIIYISRDKSEKKVLDFVNPANQNVHVSYACIAEVESIAYQNEWGKQKNRRFEEFLDEVQILQIDDTLLKTYVEIDSFSQKRHRDFDEYNFKTPRNMGKNDLYIASSASLLNLTLVTTDGDFDHLHNHFLNLRKIYPEELQNLIR
ncbi:MAG: type II toxin-antitoxin system VapC family toxin [Arcicella sp.]|nr:type II toxin-antitoxin system VapC family toxin [Arcicella sp.]